MSDAPSSNKKYVLLAVAVLVAVVASVYTEHDIKKAPEKAAGAPASAPAAKSTAEAGNGTVHMWPKVFDVMVTSSVRKKTRPVSFPFHRRSFSKTESLDFTFKVDYVEGQSTRFRIVPDDCIDTLEVNGKAVTFNKNQEAHRCDWRRGFDIDLKPYLKPDINSVHAVVRNTGGWVGLFVSAVKPK